MTTFAAIALTVLATAQTEIGVEGHIEEETPRDNYVLSARGPQAGEYVLGMGGVFMFVLPAFDARWLYAVGPTFHTDLQLKTIGVLTQIDATVRFRLVDGEAFSLAVRGGSQIQGVVFESSDDSVTGLMMSAGGGIVLSFGPEWLQWTLINEVYGGFSTESGREVTFLNNAIGVEFPVADTRNMFIEARVMTAFHPGQDPVPLTLLSLGCAW